MTSNSARTISLPVLLRRDPEQPESYCLHLLDMHFAQVRGTDPEALPGQLRDLLKRWLGSGDDRSRQAQRLLALAARKTLEAKPVPVSWRKGKRQQSRTVWIHYFSLEGREYLSLPLLDNQTLPYPGDQLTRVLADIVKKEPAGAEPDPFDHIRRLDLSVPLLFSPPRLLQLPENGRGEDPHLRGRQELDRLARPLNSRYPTRLRRAWGRADTAKKLAERLHRKENAPLVLLGDKGSGRHSLLEEVVRQQLEEQPAEAVRTFWLLNPNRIVAGMSVIGQWQSRLEAMLTYLSRPAPGRSPDILVIDRPLPLIQLGEGGKRNFSLAHLMTEWLERGRLQLLLIATPEEWGILQRQNRRFADLFLQFNLPALSLPATLPLLLRKRRAVESATGATFTIQALQELIVLYQRHLRPAALPGALGDLLDRLGREKSGQVIRAAEAGRWFFDQYGIPPMALTAEREQEAESWVRRRLIGQEGATHALLRVLALLQARLQPDGKPISSLLFIGPTGVGKTQAAKLLCEALFGDGKLLHRVDMNEYGDPGAVERLIGSFDRPEGTLSAKVRLQPFGVLLLDEIEKAHPSVHQLLLQVLDDGRLTDSRGRTSWFHNLVIIMTSNLGVREAQHQLGFQRDPQGQEAIFMRAVEKFFRPELVNRIDELVVFHSLQPEHILPIARLQINELLQRDGLLRRTTLLHIEQEALEWLAVQGYDARMGGRALKRKIEKELTALTADQLLQIPPQRPVILEIRRQEQRLQPRVIGLDFAEVGDDTFWKELAEAAGDRGWTGRLSRELEHLSQEANERSAELGPDLIPTETGQAEWAFFHHKERLQQLQEELLHLKAGSSRPRRATPLRFKQAAVIREPDTTALTDEQRDQLLDPQLLDGILLTHPVGNPLLAPEITPAALLIQQVKLAGRMQEALAAGAAPDRLRLSIRRRTGRPKPALKALLREQYAQLFEQLDLKFEWQETHSHFELEGFGLRQLLAGEAGYQLFWEPHQNQTLFSVALKGTGDAASGAERPLIRRIYLADKLLLDLRRACTCQLPLRAEELLMLV